MDKLASIVKETEANYRIYQDALRRREEGLGCAAFSQHVWNWLDGCVGGDIGSARWWVGLGLSPRWPTDGGYQLLQCFSCAGVYLSPYGINPTEDSSVQLRTNNLKKLCHPAHRYEIEAYCQLIEQKRQDALTAGKNADIERGRRIVRL